MVIYSKQFKGVSQVGCESINLKLTS